jgi:KDO2-lipid IV(A) lauroyltransferase
MKKLKKKRKKNKFTKVVEYSIAFFFLLITRSLPLRAAQVISRFLGDLLYFLSKKRRNIALENLRHAFKGEKNENEIKNIARQCCGSFFFNFLEIIKLRHIFAGTDTEGGPENPTENLNTLFLKAKKIHDESDGCLLVTPHIGNWEIIPHVCAFVGIPLVVVARPLDNEYLEQLIFKDRSATGQTIISRRNALSALQKSLQQGKAVGMLPDQSTMKGLLIDFFGRKATTTPVPALLAVTYKKPIVVVACCRKPGNYQYEGFVSDPIYPGEYTSKRDEIIRITEEMTRKMEFIIRKYPEQYLWIHNRWKTYKGKKEFMSQSAED